MFIQCCQIWCISTNLVVLNFILWILKGHCGIHKNTKSGVFERKSRKLKFNGAFVEKKLLTRGTKKQVSKSAAYVILLCCA